MDQVEILKQLIIEKNLQIDNLNQKIALANAHLNPYDANRIALYEEILAIMPEHIYWLTRDNVYLGCNDLHAEHTKLASRHDIVGKTNYDMPWKDQAQEMDAFNTFVMDSNKTHTIEESGVLAHGVRVYFSTKTPLHNEKGEVIGVLGLSTDITQQKKAEAQLRAAKEKAEIALQAKEELIINLNHNVTCPLEGLIQLAHELKTRLSQSEDKDYAQCIEKTGQQLLQMIENELDIARTHNTQAYNDTCMQILDLTNVIHDITALLSCSLKSKHIHFHCKIDEASQKKFITDSDKIQLILLKLLDYAIERTSHADIHLHIHCLSEADGYKRLRLSLKDFGESIPSYLTQDEFMQSLTQIDTLKPKHHTTIQLAQKYVGLLGGELQWTVDTTEKSNTCEFVLSLKEKSRVG